MITAHFPKHDPVNHPRHYTQHPSGIECIQITQHMGFCLGNAVKYIWRADLKNGLEDLQKAQWYIAQEIERRSRTDKPEAAAPELTGPPAALVARAAGPEAE